MATRNKLSDRELANDKAKRIMNGVDAWCSFYRANPHRFCLDYLNIKLMYALSTMLQWIWRSAIRRGEEIWLYVPSRRMRTLLKDWMERVQNGDKDEDDYE